MQVLSGDSLSSGAGDEERGPWRLNGNHWSTDNG